MTRYFRKKPVIVEAFQAEVNIDIETLNGKVRAYAGDWVVTDVKGRKYPCNQEVFEETYEEVYSLAPFMQEPRADVKISAPAGEDL